MNSDGTSLTRLCFINSKDEKKYSLKGIKEFLPIFKETSAWLDIYFKGQIPKFTPKYKIDNLTLFRQEVVDIMKTIPYGKTITYNDIAKFIAKKRKISKMSGQAVGGAVGWNPICIIIPCHRVVGANGNLTGYGGGLNNKIELLKIEKNNMQDFHLPKI
ncbi:MAG: methylated-DNA--[protein]-cysteine S-methyltransferase [bacterium]|nr:methylated-DNA--[protein]-cysteine S-methyltransferase [bacterium]